MTRNFNTSKPMTTNIRDFLREKLKDGFWFPKFTKFIKWAHNHLSLICRLNGWLTEKGNAPLGASELYQFAIATIALAWLFLIDKPLTPLLSHWLARCLGILVVGYFVIEFSLFLLNWIFVDEDKLEATTRSFATFLFNLIFELPLLFAVGFTLVDCGNPVSSFDSFLAYVNSVVGLGSLNLHDGGICNHLAY